MNKGLKPRALRVAIIGYPNVGKSALINKLLGKRRAKTANTPGVTRALQWIRITNNNNSDKNDRNGRISKRGDPQQKQLQDLELLDSPGIIPNSLEDQSDALLLAACNCIGEASYDNQAVAAYLVDYLQALYQASPQACPDWPRISQERYGVNPMKKNMGEEEEDEQHQQQSHYPNLMTGEDFLYQVADNTCQGDPEDAARKILQDFRQGRMGLCCLQVLEQRNSRGNRSNKSKHGKDVGDKEDEDLSSTSRPAILEPLPKLYQSDSGSSMSDEELAVLRQQAKEQWDEERWRRAQLAQQVAQEQGLELPPLVQQQQQMAPVASDKDRNDSSDSQPPTPRSNSRDKGLFEGW
jgi:ribosome biogenesis GTPase A